MLLALPRPSGRPSTISPFSSPTIASASASALSHVRASICASPKPARILAASQRQCQMNQLSDFPEAADLAPSLAAMGLIGEDEAFAIENLPGGVSCDVWRVATRGGRDFIVKRALPKLRVSADWF